MIKEEQSDFCVWCGQNQDNCECEDWLSLDEEDEEGERLR